MFTKNAYAQGLGTSQEYYSQFVTQDVIEAVRGWMGPSQKKVPTAEAVRRGGPLGKWLPVAESIETEALRERLGAAGDSINPVVLVCIARAAARVLRRGTVNSSGLSLSSFIADREWGW